MPNRVTPFGAIIAAPWRGALMGNRGGKIHDPATKTIIRRQASRQWIYCVLSFKGRRRAVMGAGYTELFFFDEASALAAGHRPCFECQREKAARFARAIGFARAGEIDACLDAERKAARPLVDARNLPDGAMVAVEDEAFIIEGGMLRRWTSEGYGMPEKAPARALALTPASTIAAICNGFKVG